MLSKVGALFMFIMTAAFAALAWMTLNNVWEKEPQDSADATYIGGAALWGIVALGFFGLGIWLARDR